MIYYLGNSNLQFVTCDF